MTLNIRAKDWRGVLPTPTRLLPYIRDVMNATGRFGRVAGSSIVGVALYTPPPGEMGGGEGSTQRNHSVIAPRKALTPAPRSRLGRLPSEGTRRDRGPPPARSRRGTTPTGGEEEHDAERDAPGPSRPAKATHRTARRRIASS